jgi:hypothetical protein
MEARKLLPLAMNSVAPTIEAFQTGPIHTTILRHPPTAAKRFVQFMPTKRQWREHSQTATNMWKPRLTELLGRRKQDAEKVPSTITAGALFSVRDSEQPLHQGRSLGIALIGFPLAPEQWPGVTASASGATNIVRTRAASYLASTARNTAVSTKLVGVRFSAWAKSSSFRKHAPSRRRVMGTWHL